MKTRLLLVIALVSLMLPGVARAAATSTTVNEVNQHAVVEVFDVCTNELVVFDVTFHVLESVTVDANGGTHIKLLVQGTQVVGVGQTSGTAYTGKNMFTETDYISADGTQVVTFVRPFHLVSQGSTDNRLRNILIRFTVNANSDTTVDIFFDSPTCVG